MWNRISGKPSKATESPTKDVDRSNNGREKRTSGQSSVSVRSAKAREESDPPSTNTEGYSKAHGAESEGNAALPPVGSGYTASSFNGYDEPNTFQGQMSGRGPAYDMLEPQYPHDDVVQRGPGKIESSKKEQRKKSSSTMKEIPRDANTKAGQESEETSYMQGKRDKKDRRRKSSGSKKDHESSGRSSKASGTFDARAVDSVLTTHRGVGSPEEHEAMSSHVQDQFPGQFSPQSSAPYRPPIAANEGGPGLAAEYYGDAGESVALQPGMRTHSPSLIVGAEPHLQPASSVEAPPIEPSQLGGTGAAASFYSGTFTETLSSTTQQPSTIYSTAPSRPEQSYHSASAPTIPTLGAAAAGGAAGYTMSSGSSHEHRLNQPASGSGPTSYHASSSRPPMPAKPSSHHSNAPLYAAGAAGIAGFAAATHSHSSQSSSNHGQMTQESVNLPHRQKRQRTGPVDALVNFVKDPDGVAQFEEYTEFIGVCRGCFDPNSSPRDAPRKHRHGRRRSKETCGFNARVDKQRRYSSSSEDESRRKKGMSWLGAGIAGYGLAKVGETLFNQKNDFDDTYEVKSGRYSPDRRSQAFNRRPSDRSHRDGKRHRVTSRNGSHTKSTAISYPSDRVRHPRTRSKERTSVLDGSLAESTTILPTTKQRSHSPKQVMVHDKRSSRSNSPRRRRKPKSEKRKSKKEKGFFSFMSSSSSSSLDFGLSEKDKHRKRAHSQDRINTDREAEAALLGLGAATAALAVKDARGSKKSKRSLAQSQEARVKYLPATGNHYSSHSIGSSDEVWESASEGEGAANDSDLVFGSPSRRTSSESLSSQSFGTEKWEWRWGSRDKRRRSSERDKSNELLANLASVGANSTAAILSTDQGVVPEPEDTSSGPLRYVYPVPTSDPGHFDARGEGPITPMGQPLLVSHPEVVNIQQPQPITPVSSNLYTSQVSDGQFGVTSKSSEPSYEKPAAKRVSSLSRPSSSPRQRKEADDLPKVSRLQRRETSPARIGEDSVPSSVTLPRRFSSKDDSSIVRFAVSEEQEEEERRERRRRRKEEKEANDRRQSGWKSSRDDSGQRTEPRVTREHTSGNEPDDDWKAPVAKTGAAVGAAAVVTMAPKEETRDERRERRRRERQREDEEDALSKSDRRRRKDKKRKQERDNQEQEGSRTFDSRYEVDGDGTLEEGNPMNYQSFPNRKSMWQEAASSKRPVHEDYQTFFAPVEVLNQSSNQPKIRSTDPDVGTELDRTASIVEITPKTVTKQPDEPDWSPADVKNPVVDPTIPKLRGVPALKLVQPTPPVSRASTPFFETDDINSNDQSEVTKQRKPSNTSIKDDQESDEIAPTTFHRRRDHDHSLHDDTEPNSDTDSLRQEPPAVVSKTKHSIVDSKSANSGSGSDNDFEFAATLAASAQDAGFDPSIVIDEPKYHRRDSPPGSHHAGAPDLVEHEKRSKRNRKDKKKGEKASTAANSEQVSGKRDDNAVVDDIVSQVSAFEPSGGSRDVDVAVNENFPGLEGSQHDPLSKETRAVGSENPLQTGSPLKSKSLWKRALGRSSDEDRNQGGVKSTREESLEGSLINQYGDAKQRSLLKDRRDDDQRLKSKKSAPDDDMDYHGANLNGKPRKSDRKTQGRQPEIEEPVISEIVPSDASVLRYLEELDKDEAEEQHTQESVSESFLGSRPDPPPPPDDQQENLDFRDPFQSVGQTSAEGHKRQPSEILIAESQQSPRGMPSPTAVPVSFKRPRPGQGYPRSVSQSSLYTTRSVAESRTKTKPRPRSTDYKATKGIRPLWLVERHHSHQEPSSSEPYPPLPDSHSTLAGSSVHDPHETREGFDLQQDTLQQPMMLHQVAEHNERPTIAELLGSEEAMPTAASFGESRFPSGPILESLPMLKSSGVMIGAMIGAQVANNADELGLQHDSARKDLSEQEADRLEEAESNTELPAARVQLVEDDTSSMKRVSDTPLVSDVPAPFSTQPSEEVVSPPFNSVRDKAETPVEDADTTQSPYESRKLHESGSILTPMSRDAVVEAMVYAVESEQAPSNVGHKNDTDDGTMLSVATLKDSDIVEPPLEQKVVESRQNIEGTSTPKSSSKFQSARSLDGHQDSRHLPLNESLQDSGEALYSIRTPSREPMTSATQVPEREEAAVPAGDSDAPPQGSQAKGTGPTNAPIATTRGGSNKGKKSQKAKRQVIPLSESELPTEDAQDPTAGGEFLLEHRPDSHSEPVSRDLEAEKPKSDNFEATVTRTGVHLAEKSMLDPLRATEEKDEQPQPHEWEGQGSQPEENLGVERPSAGDTRMGGSAPDKQIFEDLRAEEFPFVTKKKTKKGKTQKRKTIELGTGKDSRIETPNQDLVPVRELEDEIVLSTRRSQEAAAVAPTKDESFASLVSGLETGDTGSPDFLVDETPEIVANPSFSAKPTEGKGNIKSVRNETADLSDITTKETLMDLSMAVEIGVPSTGLPTDDSTSANADMRSQIIHFPGKFEGESEFALANQFESSKPHEITNIADAPLDDIKADPDGPSYTAHVSLDRYPVSLGESDIDVERNEVDTHKSQNQEPDIQSTEPSKEEKKLEGAVQVASDKQAALATERPRIHEIIDPMKESSLISFSPHKALSTSGFLGAEQDGSNDLIQPDPLHPDDTGKQVQAFPSSSDTGFRSTEPVISTEVAPPPAEETPFSANEVGHVTVPPAIQDRKASGTSDLVRVELFSAVEAPEGPKDTPSKRKKDKKGKKVKSVSFDLAGFDDDVKPMQGTSMENSDVQGMPQDASPEGPPSSTVATEPESVDTLDHPGPSKREKDSKMAKNVKISSQDQDIIPSTETETVPSTESIVQEGEENHIVNAAEVQDCSVADPPISSISEDPKSAAIDENSTPFKRKKSKKRAKRAQVFSLEEDTIPPTEAEAIPSADFTMQRGELDLDKHPADAQDTSVAYSTASTGLENPDRAAEENEFPIFKSTKDQKKAKRAQVLQSKDDIPPLMEDPPMPSEEPSIDNTELCRDKDLSTIEGPIVPQETNSNLDPHDLVATPSKKKKGKRAKKSEVFPLDGETSNPTGFEEDEVSKRNVDEQVTLGPNAQKERGDPQPDVELSGGLYNAPMSKNDRQKSKRSKAFSSWDENAPVPTPVEKNVQDSPIAPEELQAEEPQDVRSAEDPAEEVYEMPKSKKNKKKSKQSKAHSFDNEGIPTPTFIEENVQSSTALKAPRAEEPQGLQAGYISNQENYEMSKSKKTKKRSKRSKAQSFEDDETIIPTSTEEDMQGSITALEEPGAEEAPRSQPSEALPSSFGGAVSEIDLHPDERATNVAPNAQIHPISSSGMEVLSNAAVRASSPLEAPVAESLRESEENLTLGIDQVKVMPKKQHLDDVSSPAFDTAEAKTPEEDRNTVTAETSDNTFDVTSAPIESSPGQKNLRVQPSESTEAYARDTPDELSAPETALKESSKGGESANEEISNDAETSRAAIDAVISDTVNTQAAEQGEVKDLEVPPSMPEPIVAVDENANVVPIASTGLQVAEDTHDQSRSLAEPPPIDTPLSAGSVDLLDAEQQRQYDEAYARELQKQLGSQTDNSTTDIQLEESALAETKPMGSEDPVYEHRQEALSKAATLERIAEEPDSRSASFRDTVTPQQEELGPDEPAKRNKKGKKGKKRKQSIPPDDERSFPAASLSTGNNLAQGPNTDMKPSDLEENIEPHHAHDKEDTSPKQPPTSFAEEGSIPTKNQVADYSSIQHSQRVEKDVIESATAQSSAQEPTPWELVSDHPDPDSIERKADDPATSEPADSTWEPLPSKKGKKGKKGKKTQSSALGQVEIAPPRREGLETQTTVPAEAMLHEEVDEPQVVDRRSLEKENDPCRDVATLTSAMDTDASAAQKVSRKQSKKEKEKDKKQGKDLTALELEDPEPEPLAKASQQAEPSQMALPMETSHPDKRRLKPRSRDSPPASGIEEINQPASATLRDDDWAGEDRDFTIQAANMAETGPVPDIERDSSYRDMDPPSSTFERASSAGDSAERDYIDEYVSPQLKPQTSTEDDIIESYGESFAESGPAPHVPETDTGESISPMRSADEDIVALPAQHIATPNKKLERRRSRRASNAAHDSDDSEDSGFDVQKRRRRMEALAEDQREPSPVESTTRDRSSALFDSSPSARNVVSESTEDAVSLASQASSQPPQATVPPSSSREVLPGPTWSFNQLEQKDNAHSTSLFGGPIKDEDAISRSESPLTSDNRGHQIPRTISERSSHESPHSTLSKKDKRAASDVGSPESGVKARRTSENRQQQGKVLGLSTENTKSISPRLSEEREKYRSGLEHPVGSQAERRASRQSNLSTAPSIESVYAIIRTPEQICSPSGQSFQSTGTPPLRRVDRSVSSDLRAASRKTEAGAKSGASGKITDEAGLQTKPERNIPYASSSIYNPLTDKGKTKAGADGEMANFEGWGDVRGQSPISPTRPPSLRKLQSMQFSEMEQRLAMLASENGLLQTAKSKAERRLEEQANDHSQQRHTYDEALQDHKAYVAERDVTLRELNTIVDGLRQQVTHLTEANEELMQSRGIDGPEEHHDREQTSRELELLRLQHTRLATEHEDIVTRESDAVRAEKDNELVQLRQELEDAKEQVRRLQQQMLASRSTEDLVEHDEDYFDAKCQELCKHLTSWVTRFSKLSDNRRCYRAAEMRNDAHRDVFEDSMLDGSEVDDYLQDRHKRRDVFLSVTMSLIFKHIFARYLFGMDREHRQKLKTLDKTLQEVGPPSAVHKWRATTLTLLSRRPAFQSQRDADSEGVIEDVWSTLSTALPPPSTPQAEHCRESLRRIINLAVDLSIDMRLQRAEYSMLPPPEPEFDPDNGEITNRLNFRAASMNERSGVQYSNEELEEQGTFLRIVLFPLVVKNTDEEEHIVVCPAQVHIAPLKKGKTVRVVSAAGNRSEASLVSNGEDAVMEGGMF